MIKDLDYSFIRLRDNYEEACDTNFSPATELSYAGYAIHLIPGEIYLQITNSPVNIDMASANVHVLNTCGEVIDDITASIFINQFTDVNGIKQIAWEWVCNQDYPQGVVSLRFTGKASGKVYYTNYFNCTLLDSKLTTRFDYKSQFRHYGTDYANANYYQGIRLRAFYNNLINESERSEYHQISTDVTVDTRNIRKIKERYLLESWDDFSVLRFETLLTSELVYVDTYRKYSSEAIEFEQRELDSDISEMECILNPDYSQAAFVSDYQIFAGAVVLLYTPIGVHASGVQFTKYGMRFSEVITINTGFITVYDASDDSVFYQFDESEMVLTEADVTVVGNAIGTVAENPPDGNYYVHATAGLVSVAGVPSDAVSDDSTWTFSIVGGEYEETEYDNTEYLT